MHPTPLWRIAGSLLPWRPPSYNPAELPAWYTSLPPSSGRSPPQSSAPADTILHLPCYIADTSKPTTAIAQSKQDRTAANSRSAQSQIPAPPAPPALRAAAVCPPPLASDCPDIAGPGCDTPLPPAWHGCSRGPPSPSAGTGCWQSSAVPRPPPACWERTSQSRDTP